MIVVYIILIIVAVYLAAGAVFAIPFIIKGVSAIDEGAHGSTWGFRIIIIPGTIVFWPLLLKKWWSCLNSTDKKEPQRPKGSKRH